MLKADVEIGGMGGHLAAGGLYYVHCVDANRHLDRATAQRIGKATIEEFVDAPATPVERLAIELSNRNSGHLLPLLDGLNPPCVLAASDR